MSGGPNVKGGGKMKKDTDTITALDFTSFNRETVRRAVKDLIENHQYTSDDISEWLLWMFC